MPFGVIHLPTDDTVMPEMAYTGDTKAALLPMPTSLEHVEQGCNCARRSNNRKIWARRAFCHVVFAGLTFVLVKAAFAHFDVKPWQNRTMTGAKVILLSRIF